MRFKRFLAILLLLILPLQSTLAAIDGCCNGTTGGQTLAYQADLAQSGEEAGSKQIADDADCCAFCDSCNHSSVSFRAPQGDLHGEKLTSAPVAHPELPIDSFIPDVPSRPDRA
ncbi:hypothetical protein LP420_41195 [Massilia sp. B-10]|nr:hypothetical protein LP420_41195 [Massilia sp. B-10]UUZ54532.1 hypothetical protein LP419_40550 [Massilia sp. H-1]